MLMKQILKRVFPGVSWQNPILNIIFKAVNPIDSLVRRVHGLSELPPYSIRVRSNGVTKQFGGKNFTAFGNLLADLLEKFALLNNKSKVLEIGCGCGRTAFALSGKLDDGGYVGMDIEKISLESCKDRPIFIRKSFDFVYLDIKNDEYNPDGKNYANTYTFPYNDDSFDVIFLVSVFTHMLTADVTNYIKEISRMLKPGGVCMTTTFLMDKGRETNGLSFPFKCDEHYYYDQSLPEVAVGYYLDFYLKEFSSSSMRQLQEPLWGGWRKSSNVVAPSGFAQDILFFCRD